MNHYDQLMQKLTDFGDAPLEKQEPHLISESDLDALEESIGYSLPADYREFLRHYAGFAVYKGYSIPKAKNTRTKEAGFYSFFDLQALRNQSSLLTRGIEEFLPPAPLVIGVGDNGYTLMALAGEYRGSVYFWDSGQTGSSDESENIHLIATSFDEFIHLLRA